MVFDIIFYCETVKKLYKLQFSRYKVNHFFSCHFVSFITRNENYYFTEACGVEIHFRIAGGSYCPVFHT